MNCPHCSSPIEPSARSCPHCGFEASHLHRTIGSQWVRLARLTDAAQCLGLEDHRQTEVLLNHFERNFPQAFFAAYLGVLPVSLSVSELGFWLLNQGAFDTPSINRRNDFGLILVIDPASKYVSLTIGYALEALFSAAQVNAMLARAGKDLSRCEFARAIAEVCKQCSKIIRKNGQRCVWSPEAYGSGIEPAGHLGLETLRGGGRLVSDQGRSTRTPA